MMPGVIAIHGVWWGLDRGAGLAALALLTVATLLGAATGPRLDSARGRRVSPAAVYRDLCLLAVAFGAVHAISAVADRLDLRPVDMVAPFGARFEPFWTGLGALSVDLLLAAGITIVLRRRLGPGAWRAVRWLAYGCWAIAVLHTVGIGSDVAGPRGLALSSACAGLLAAALAWRSLAAGAPLEAPPAVRRPEPVPEPPPPEPVPVPVPGHVVPSPLWSSGESPDRG